MNIIIDVCKTLKKNYNVFERHHICMNIGFYTYSLRVEGNYANLWFIISFHLKE
jgi:hypothetical protein